MCPVGQQKSAGARLQQGGQNEKFEKSRFRLSNGGVEAVLGQQFGADDRNC